MSKESTAGIIALHVSIKVDADELRTWPPDSIKEFFDGIAKVQAAVNQARQTEVLTTKEPT